MTSELDAAETIGGVLTGCGASRRLARLIEGA